MIRLLALLTIAAAAAVLVPSMAPAAQHGCAPRPPDTARPVTAPRWLAGAVVTEYYPVRESWFRGKAMPAPGLTDRHRLDWLYGPHGVAMNGEGLGRDGRYYRFAGPYDIGWVNQQGARTSGCWNGDWTNGEPAWLDLGWRSHGGQVTYPLSGSGWSNGVGSRYIASPATLRFAVGRSALPFWHTVAVDPMVIPRGSRVFIPAYCDTPAHGWFRALDTGGAIIGYHFDVYRAPPRQLILHALRDQHVYVLPSGHTLPAHSSARCP